MTFLKNKDLYCHSVLYEDLTTDSKGHASKMLSDLGIDNQGASLKAILRGLEFDSQNGTFKGIPPTRRFSDDDWNISDMIQEQIQSPVKMDTTIDQLRNLVSIL